jgi:hypothetical protein
MYDRVVMTLYCLHQVLGTILNSKGRFDHHHQPIEARLLGKFGHCSSSIVQCRTYQSSQAFRYFDLRLSELVSRGYDTNNTVLV